MRKAKALCPDAKIRTVYYKEPNTFFPISAYVIVHRNRKEITVRGFITMSHPDDIPPSLRTERGYEFHPYDKYRDIIPNYLESVKAMWRRTTLDYPPKWRWIWDGLKYSDKWGTA